MSQILIFMVRTENFFVQMKSLLDSASGGGGGAGWGGVLCGICESLTRNFPVGGKAFTVEGFMITLEGKGWTS